MDGKPSTRGRKLEKNITYSLVFVRNRRIVRDCIPAERQVTMTI